jgi:hypothetical protein
MATPKRNTPKNGKKVGADNKTAGTIKLKISETPEFAQNCTICGELTNKLFTLEGTKQSVRACGEEHAGKYFAKKQSVKSNKAKSNGEKKPPVEKSTPKKVAPRRQAVANVIKKLGDPIMETILNKTPKFSDDPRKDKHATSDTVFRMWAYDELLKKEGKGKTARYSVSAKGKKEFEIK